MQRSNAHRHAALVTGFAALFAGGITARAARPVAGSITSERLKPPSGPSSVRGLADEPTVDPFYAQVHYQVPIEVPAGRGGLSPALALVYSGGLGNGPLGIGWSLGGARIQRSTRTGVPSFGADDTLEIMGVASGRLVAIDATEYRVEGQGQTVRVVRVGDGFEVDDGTGVHYKLGLAATGRQGPDLAHTAAWLVEEATNTQGERIRFEYLHDQGQVYLSRVSWGPDDVYRVDLGYTARTDATRSYRDGFSVVTGQLLATVTVRVAGIERRAYQLTYDATFPVARLARVTSTGVGGAGAWPVVSFRYATPAAAAVTPIAGVGAWRLNTTGTTLVDLDGDGAADLLQLASGGHSYRPNRDGVFGTALALAGVTQGIDALQLHDVDGDARADLVQDTGAGWAVWKWTKTQWVSQTAALPGAIWPGSNGIAARQPSVVRFADLDGDGLVDPIMWNNDGLRVRIATPTGLPATATSVGRIGGSVVPTEQGRFHDLNGDGLDDYIVVGLTQLETFLGHGDGTFDPLVPVAYPVAGTWTSDAVELADLDRDGLMDLVRIDVGTVRWFHGRPDGTFDPTPVMLANPEPLATEVVVAVADSNGNGSQDVIWSSPAGMWRMDLAGTTTAGMLIDVDNGLGMDTAFAYQSSHALSAAARAAGTAWTSEIPIAMPVPVQTVTTLGPGEPIRQVSYAVKDGVWDAIEQQFAGFLQTTVTTAGATPAETGSVITRYYNGTGVDRELRGRPLTVQVKDGTGRRLSLTTNTWKSAPIDGLPDVPLLRRAALRETRVRYEDTTPVRETHVVNQHDGLGRVIHTVDEGRTDLTGDDTVTDHRYADDATHWIRDRECEQTISSTAGAIASQTQHLFGDATTVAPLCAAGAGWPRETRGWLASEGRFVTTTATAYDAHGNPTSIVSGGVETELSYDPTGRFAVEERKLGAAGAELVWTATWDEVLGVIATVTGPDGHVNRASYDPLGRLVGTAIDGHEPHQVLEYDWTGSFPKTVVWEYDGPIAELGVKPAAWSATDHWRQRVEVANGKGERRYQAQRLGAATWIVSGYQERDPSSRVVFAGRPALTAQLELAARPAGMVGDTLVYDPIGRLITQQLPTGTTRTYSYTAFERTMQEADLAPIHSVLDGAGRAILTERSLSDGSHELVEASYDAAGRLTQMRLAGGTVQRDFGYDTLGRLVSSSDPDLGIRTLTWDDGGRLTSEHNAVGQAITYGYDGFGRLISRDAGASYHYHYDVARPGAGTQATNLAGRLAWVEEPTGGLDLGYDAFGRTAFTRRRIDGAVSEATTAFAPSGLVLSRGYDDGLALDYQYDPAGRLVGIGDLWQLLDQDAAGLPLHERTQNGVETTYERDVLGLTARVTVTDSSGAPIYDVAATRNAATALTAIADLDGVGLDQSATFGYDGFARLTTASVGQGAAAYHFGYGYDVLHNMQSRTMTGPTSIGAFFGIQRYGEAGHAPRQLTSIVDAAGAVLHSFDYDAAGRQIAQDELELSYDPADRLVRVDGLVDGAVQHVYGHDGERVKTVAPDGGVAVFFGDGTAERGGVREHDVAVGDRIIARVAMRGDEAVDEAAAAGGGAAARAGGSSPGAGLIALGGIALGLIALGLRLAGSRRARRRLATAAVAASVAAAAGCTSAVTPSTSTGLVVIATPTFAHAGLGPGPVVFTDAAGAIVEERRIEPFGAPIEAPDLVARDLNPLNKRSDPSTGWSDHGARWLAPATARWLTPDPPVAAPDAAFMRAPWSLHPYQYVGQNPVAFWDPQGTCSAPVGLAPGQVGICIEAFIAAATVGPLGIGLGDHRGHDGNNAGASNRLQQQITFDPANHALVNTTSLSKSEFSLHENWLFRIGGSRQGTGSTVIDRNVHTTIDGASFTTFSAGGRGINGFSGLPGAPSGSIDYRFNFRIDESTGEVTLINGMHKGFPSYGVYAYRIGADGQTETTTLHQSYEHDIDDLDTGFNGVTQHPVLLDAPFHGVAVLKDDDD